MKGYLDIGSHASRQSGYSLFEVLIAIVVTSIGLLGLAGIQATGLNNNLRAYQRSQATVLAYDIADRMRANTAAIDNYLSSNMTLDQAVAAGAVAGCTTPDGCTPAELAQTDLVDWRAAMTAAIPGSIGEITVLGNTYTITLNWDDNRDGFVNSDPDDEIEDDPSFQVSFQP